MIKYKCIKLKSLLVTFHDPVLHALVTFHLQFTFYFQSYLATYSHIPATFHFQSHTSHIPLLVISSHIPLLVTYQPHYTSSHIQQQPHSISSLIKLHSTSSRIQLHSTSSSIQPHFTSSRIQLLVHSSSCHIPSLLITFHFQSDALQTSHDGWCSATPQ